MFFRCSCRKFLRFFSLSCSSSQHSSFQHNFCHILLLVIPYIDLWVYFGKDFDKWYLAQGGNGVGASKFLKLPRGLGGHKTSQRRFVVTFLSGSSSIDFLYVVNAAKQKERNARSLSKVFSSGPSFCCLAVKWVCKWSWEIMDAHKKMGDSDVMDICCRLSEPKHYKLFNFYLRLFHSVNLRSLWKESLMVLCARGWWML